MALFVMVKVRVLGDTMSLHEVFLGPVWLINETRCRLFFIPFWAMEDGDNLVSCVKADFEDLFSEVRDVLAEARSGSGLVTFDEVASLKARLIQSLARVFIALSQAELAKLLRE